MPFAVVDEVVGVVVPLVKARLEGFDERLREEGFQLRIETADVRPVVSWPGFIKILQPHRGEGAAVQV